MALNYSGVEGKEYMAYFHGFLDKIRKLGDKIPLLGDIVKVDLDDSKKDLKTSCIIFGNYRVLLTI